MPSHPQTGAPLAAQVTTIGLQSPASLPQLVPTHSEPAVQVSAEVLHGVAAHAFGQPPGTIASSVVPLTTGTEPAGHPSVGHGAQSVGHEVPPGVFTG
jgi:metal-dependent HD superfamily phosphatase/phosphodiesterase